MAEYYGEKEISDSERVEMLIQLLRTLKISQIRAQLDHDVWANPMRYSMVAGFVLAACDQPATLG